MGCFRPLGHDKGEALAGCRQIFIKRPAMNGHGFMHPVASLGQARCQSVAARGNVIGDPLAGFIQLLHHMIATRTKVYQQGMSGRVEAAVNFAHLIGQGRHHIMAGLGQMLRHLAARLCQA